jgi:hypothetical protein
MLEVVQSLSSARAKNAEHGDMQTFLERLLLEVISLNYRYFVQERLAWGKVGAERWCWPPLLANERQVSGLYAQALSQVCPVSRPELGITRSQSKDQLDEGRATESNGRIDYFATYGRRSVGLELKRVAVSTFADKFSWGNLKRNWKKVDEQALQCLQYMRKTPADFPYAVGVGLLVVRVGRTIAQATSETARVDAEARFGELTPAMQKAMKPDFLAVYRPPREMQVSDGWGKNQDKSAVFPGVLFAASVHVRAAKAG